MCRVYMFGANAKGQLNDTAAAAVLTAMISGREFKTLGQPPEVLQFNDHTGYVWNQTLPFGFFSRSPLGPVTGIKYIHIARCPWHDWVTALLAVVLFAVHYVHMCASCAICSQLGGGGALCSLLAEYDS